MTKIRDDVRVNLGMKDKPHQLRRCLIFSSCRENIQTWLVGRVKETRAIEKLSLIFGSDGAKLLEKLGQHATVEFCIVRRDLLAKFKAEMNLLRTEQMSDAEILQAAKKTIPSR